MAKHHPATTHRLDRLAGASQRHWDAMQAPQQERMRADVTVDMGWGRLLFAHTFSSPEALAEELCREEPGRRDVALYVHDPHVVLSLRPHELFLDPSHTYRLWSQKYRPSPQRPQGFIVRRLRTRSDAEAINRIYAGRHMVTADVDVMMQRRQSRLVTYLVAEDQSSGEVIGTVTGVDHRRAFDDVENGASFWCLAVDPQAPLPGVGIWLVRHIVEHFLARGRQYVDLSVIHDNEEAMALYEKLGFQRAPVFCVKHKNPINEPLFTAPAPEESLNPYGRIIVDEARRRGIVVDVIDAEGGYFALHFGGRQVVCRESLSELTTAIAMSRCQDKRQTQRLLKGAGLSVPANRISDGGEGDRRFLAEHGSVVIKPICGEQAAGVSVDLRTEGEVERAIEAARRHSAQVMIEQFVEGEDLRVIVIDFKMVAGAVRRPPAISGTGRHTIEQLIEKHNRRRAAATGGESHTPIDDETRRCVEAAGYRLDSTLPVGQTLTVRRTANVHTGGTIHDVTEQVSPAIADAAVRAARALDIPVVGLDLIVPTVSGDEYHIIEANERPGLANHEPRPTAERFIDLLFPNSVIPNAR